MLEIFSVEGKKAFMSEVSRGLGRDMALTLAEPGADVALAARTVATLEQTKRQQFYDQIGGGGRRRPQHGGVIGVIVSVAWGDPVEEGNPSHNLHYGLQQHFGSWEHVI